MYIFEDFFLVLFKRLKENEEIVPQSSQRYKVRHDDSGVHSLEISDIISDDEGEYLCVASNSESKTLCSTKLIMKGKTKCQDVRLLTLGLQGIALYMNS